MKKRTSMVLWKRRTVIEVLNVKNPKSIDIHIRLIAVFGDDMTDINNVRRWVLRVKSSDKDEISQILDKMNVYDTPQSGHHQILRNTKYYKYYIIKYSY